MTELRVSLVEETDELGNALEPDSRLCVDLDAGDPTTPVAD